MFKKAALALLITGTSFSSFANWVGGVSYINLSEDDISMGGVTGSVAYKIESNGNFNFIPEIRLGTGVVDDTYFGVDVGIMRFTSFSVRGQYEIESGQSYLFITPSYANVDFDVSYGSRSVSEDTTEFGIGGGFGYHFSESTAAELTYERFDGTNVISLGIKFGY